jgi:hypothetical protein
MINALKSVITYNYIADLQCRLDCDGWNIIHSSKGKDNVPDMTKYIWTDAQSHGISASLESDNLISAGIILKSTGNQFYQETRG